MKKPWYERWGPFRWYRDAGDARLSWFEFSLYWDKYHLVTVLLRGNYRWHVLLLGKVARRSLYGSPSTYDRAILVQSMRRRTWE